MPYPTLSLGTIPDHQDVAQKDSFKQKKKTNQPHPLPNPQNNKKTQNKTKSPKPTVAINQKITETVTHRQTQLQV